ncbi:hypothetical protein T07_12892 [Trichinella nelsoni]|uniref:Uncharacterized protein n=1 Tax=Trichinella nelsoni TaxID=6336 RepID=A0A0V0S5K8_9BILA|nr:hypothetical protein T07_12892 [Trichinella nelsoni]
MPTNSPLMVELLEIVKFSQSSLCSVFSFKGWMQLSLRSHFEMGETVLEKLLRTEKPTDPY